jgi:hypothetical protein
LSNAGGIAYGYSGYALAGGFEASYGSIPIDLEGVTRTFRGRATGPKWAF